MAQFFSKHRFYFAQNCNGNLAKVILCLAAGEQELVDGKGERPLMGKNSHFSTTTLVKRSNVQLGQSLFDTTTILTFEPIFVYF